MLAYDYMKDVWQLEAKSQCKDVAVMCLNIKAPFSPFRVQ